jgi:hypothetical protein
MRKAYMLVICLLATTLTGCLDDNNDTTEQKISPVGDEGDQNGGNTTTYSPYSNITMRYDSENYFANFSKPERSSLLRTPEPIGSTVHATFTEPFTAFIWFYDYSGNEIRHNRLYQGYDNCYSNGNWSAWDSNGSADCMEQYIIDPESVIWEFNLARTPMSVGIGQTHLYYLESF